MLVAAGAAAVAAWHGPSGQAAMACSSGYYRNVNGVCVHGPVAAARAPAGATARCRDGTYSFSLHASGTCSHHGGVALWIVHR